MFSFFCNVFNSLTSQAGSLKADNVWKKSTINYLEKTLFSFPTMFAKVFLVTTIQTRNSLEKDKLLKEKLSLDLSDYQVFSPRNISLPHSTNFTLYLTTNFKLVKTEEIRRRQNKFDSKIKTCFGKALREMFSQCFPKCFFFFF